MSEFFGHFSDPATLAHEDEENQGVLLDQAARLHRRREASFARAVYYAMKLAMAGPDPQTKHQPGYAELVAIYPELEE